MKSWILHPSPSRNCEGVARRDLLRVGTLSFFGLSLPQLLQLRAAAGAAAAPRAESVILLWCSGGPSHLDTFDPKPDAPSEIRGEFKAIETSVPGVQISEHLPETAKVMNRVSLVRSLTSQIAAHEQASQYLMTGYRPLPTLEYPSYGSVVAKELGSRNNLPPYIATPDISRAGQSGFIGAAYNAFEAPDASLPGFRVPNVNSPLRVDEDRMARRRGFTQRMNDRFSGSLPDDRVRAVDQFYTKAFDLINSSAAKRAFELSEEPESLREKYGMTTMGQGALLARRLSEAGARFITVNKNGWDNHQNIFGLLTGAGGPARPAAGAGGRRQAGLLPELDRAFSGLISDLADRGSLDKTLVVLMGEFGRTPRVNPRGGRDHWSRCRFVAFAGAGVRGGQVIGKSDSEGGVPTDRPVSVEEVAATLYHALGIDHQKQYTTPTGRPIHLAQSPTHIHELWG
jgi:hypothetical protein